MKFSVNSIQIESLCSLGNKGTDLFLGTADCLKLARYDNTIMSAYCILYKYPIDVKPNNNMQSINMT